MAFLSRARESSRVVAAALIVALLIGGLPSLSGVIVTRTDGGPVLTVNICHPPPGLDRSSGFSPVPLMEEPPSPGRLLPCGIVYEAETVRMIRAGEAPDPPPPKSMG